MSQHVVYKHHLAPHTGTQSIVVPHCAKLLSVREQRNIPCLWVEGNPDSKWPQKEIFIDAFETGTHFEVSDDFSREFLGTVLLDSGAYVLHYYVRRKS